MVYIPFVVVSNRTRHSSKLCRNLTLLLTSIRHEASAIWISVSVSRPFRTKKVCLDLDRNHDFTVSELLYFGCIYCWNGIHLHIKYPLSNIKLCHLISSIGYLVALRNNYMSLCKYWTVEALILNPDLYEGCSGSSWNLVIKFPNIDIIL